MTRTAPAAETEALVRELRAALGDATAVLDEPLSLSLYARDASVIVGQAGAVCFPVSTEEVQAVVRVARRHGRAIVPRGSGTGLAGGAVPVAGDPERPPVVVVTTKMDRVLEVDVDDRIAWVEPGVLNLDLSAAVHARAALRPRPVEPAVVLDRRQRGQQLGRPALPRLRRDQRPRPGLRGRAARTGR